MAISLVQTAAGGVSSGTSAPATWGSNTTTGNLIAVVIAHAAGAVSSISDSQSNTYVQINTQTVSSAYVLDMWYAKNITGGTTPTVTAHLASSIQANIIVREYSGLDTSAPLDQNTINNGIGGTASSGNTSTTTQANELLIGGLTSLAGTITVGSGYGNLTSETFSGTTISGYMEDQIVSSTGAYAATFGGPASIWICGIATFIAAGAVTPVTPYIPSFRIPNKYVGPQALRYAFQQPQILFNTQNAAPVVSSSSSTLPMLGVG